MTTSTDRPTVRRLVATTVALGVVALAACGDDDADESSSPSTSDPTTESTTDPPDEPGVCEPYLQVSAAFAGEPDPATIGGLLDEVDATAPDPIADQMEVMTAGARTVLETGDFAVFESDEFNDAVGAADGWVFENCAFETTTEIVAKDYLYEGQATAYPAGRTAIALVNEGVEAHELVILRKSDGVDLGLDELLELPEDDAESMTTYVGGTFVGPPGATSSLVLDLSPGDYVAVCNVPAGTMVADDGSFVEGTGEPHVMLGMSFEFTVT